MAVGALMTMIGSARTWTGGLCPPYQAGLRPGLPFTARTGNQSAE